MWLSDTARWTAHVAAALACVASAWAAAAVSHGSAAQGGPPVAQVNQTALAAMPERARVVVASAPVPVLIPMEPQLLGGAVMTVGNGYYSMFSRTGDLTLNVQGSPITNTTTTVAAGSPRATQIGARRVFTTLNEGIRTASWVENGVAYSLDLECARPQDVRCESEQFVTELISKLTFVGGGTR